MEKLEYLNFTLRMARDGDHYEAAVIDSPRGEASTPFISPFTQEEIGEFLGLVGQYHEKGSGVEKAIKRFGGRLFERVFANRVSELLRRSLDEAEGQKKGLRIQLRLTAVPELADLPWEYLYNPNSETFYCLSSKTPIVRYSEVPERIRPMPIDPPVRILVMISNPSTPQYPPLDVEQEWANLNRSLSNMLSKGLVELEQMPGSASELRRRLRPGGRTYHIFHFIGHGGFDPAAAEGFLVMGDEDAPALSGDMLDYYLQDHDSLRLVVLTACQSARSSRANYFGGMAQSLVQKNIPAVIAMQLPVSDEGAIRFSEVFYEAIADYCPVDTALAEARKAMFSSKMPAEWGTPTLYMRAMDASIFEKSRPVSVTDVNKHRDPDLERDPNGLHYLAMMRAITMGTMVPFLGPRANLSGRVLCTPQGLYPLSDDELAGRLAEACFTTGAQDLVRLSQHIQLKNPKGLALGLNHALDASFCPTVSHQFLAALPGILREKGYPHPHQLIVTANYDDALERAFDEREPPEPYDLVCYDANQGPDGGFCHRPPGGQTKPIKAAKGFQELSLQQRTVILKINGALNRSNPEQRSYAVTEDDYIRYLSGISARKVLPREIILKLNEGQFLFLGHRLFEWHLRVIFDRIGRDKLAESWVIQPDSDLDREFWDSRGAAILNIGLDEFINTLQKRVHDLPRFNGAL